MDNRTEVDSVLEHHTPDQAAYMRAEAAGVDLEELKRRDPAQYKMLNAQRLLRTEPALVGKASDVFFAAFRHYELFQLSEGENVTLLAFPPLTLPELKRFDDALGRLVALPAYQEQQVYYRVVNDLQGEHRELALPLAPGGWAGEVGLIGPFETQAETEAWGDAHVQAQAELAYDAVPHAGAWFCDVFFG